MLIINFFGDNLTNLNTLGVCMIFQRNNNNKVQLYISKLQFYDLIITSSCNFSKKVKDQISPDRLKKLSIIKIGLFEYSGLTSTEFDIFMKEDIIENTNNKRNIDVPKLIDDSMQHKQVSNENLDENELKMKFAEALLFLNREWSNKFELNEEEKSELSECLKGKKNYKHK